jgi:hypothetical protein
MGAKMNLHPYKIREGYLVEEADTFRLLAHIPGAPVEWGFTENSDLAAVFATEAEALAAAAPWMAK